MPVLVRICSAYTISRHCAKTYPGVAGRGFWRITEWDTSPTRRWRFTGKWYTMSKSKWDLQGQNIPVRPGSQSDKYKPTIHPLTPERWPDLEQLFGPRGACAGCWCMLVHVVSIEAVNV